MPHCIALPSDESEEEDSIDLDTDVSEEEGSIDSDDPPAQNSPRHILNALDDFCIQTIFRNLTKFLDFLNASDVCKRFRDNAKPCFPLMFKTIGITECLNNHDYSGNNYYYGGRYEDKWSISSVDDGIAVDVNDEDEDEDKNDNRLLSWKQQQSVLRIFGHLIYGIRYRVCGKCAPELETEEGEESQCELFKLIIKFCSKTLIELSVNDNSRRILASITLPSNSFKKRNQFQALTRLEMRKVKVKKMLFSPTLKRLRLYYINAANFRNLIVPYPELLEFKFDLDWDKLGIHPERWESWENQYEAKFVILKFLKLNPQIVSFKCGGFDIDVKDIYKHVPNLEKFGCTHVNGDLSDSEIFHNLKDLTIYRLANAQLTIVARNMPNLERIKIISSYNSLTRPYFNAAGIINALELAKHLKKIHFRGMDLDSESYYSILSSIKKRTNPYLMRVNDIRGVPKDIIDSNSKWICGYCRIY